MSHSTTLIGTITERARPKVKEGMTYVETKKIWLEEAKAWRAQLAAEGLLTKTIEQLDKTIKFFEQGNGK